MSSLDDTPTCGDYKDGEIPSNKKVCTSYDQKAEDIKNDETSNNNSADVDLSGALRHLHLNLRSGTTNNDYDDDELLFQDPPPKEDCQICMQPMPFYFKAYRQQFSQTIVNFFPYFMNFTTAAANQYLIHYHLPIVASHVVLAKILFIN